MKKNMVYFVLYIVLITELLIVIQERDILVEAEEKIKENLIASLAESYTQDLILSIPDDYSTHNLKKSSSTNVAMIPIGVISESEKKRLEYYVKLAEDSPEPRGWPGDELSLNNGNNNFKLEKRNGNAVFISDFSNSGTFEFIAYCKVERNIPDYITGELLEYFKEKVGVEGEDVETEIIKQSGDEKFTIEAESPGVSKKRTTISG